MVPGPEIVDSGLLAKGGLLAGLLNLVVVMGPDFYLSFIRVWVTVASFLGLHKQPRAWGVVYDSVTKRPLDPAYVSLFDETGRELASTITSIDGRYGFLVPPGAYTLKVERTHYHFPSKRLLGLESDVLYSDLYFGGPITVDEQGLVLHNIPLDPLAFDWNEFAKKDRKLLRFYARISALQGRLISWFFIVGFCASIILPFISRQPVNIAIALLYIAIGIVQSVMHHSDLAGMVVEQKSKTPAPFAIVRVFSADGATEIGHAVADQFGRYYCLVPPGNYLAKIERKNEDGSYTEVAHTPVTAPTGIIKEKFRI